MASKTTKVTITVNGKENYYIYVSNPFPQWWIDEARDFIEANNIKGLWQITDYKPLY